MHGLPRIIKSNNTIVKLVWLVMILISSACGVYFVFSTIYDYLQYDVVAQLFA